jgi:hypothetical protein
MQELSRSFEGGCLCGALRYRADGPPRMSGYCCCGDCRKATGSGYVGFMGFASANIRFSGPSRSFACRSARGTDAMRNVCGVCNSLVFGGERGVDDAHTIYAGSLDNPALFKPTLAIFTEAMPDWVRLPPGLHLFERMPE